MLLLLSAALAQDEEAVVLPAPPMTAIEYQVSLHAPGLSERLNPHLDPPDAPSQDFVDGYAAGMEDAAELRLTGSAVAGTAAGCVAGLGCLLAPVVGCLVYPATTAAVGGLAMRAPSGLSGNSDTPPDWVLGWQAGYANELQRRRVRTVAVGSLIGLGVSAVAYTGVVAVSNGD